MFWVCRGPSGDIRFDRIVGTDATRKADPKFPQAREILLKSLVASSPQRDRSRLVSAN